MPCSIRYVFHTIRYVSCTIRYVFSRIRQLQAPHTLFMCCSAFQDLYHLRLLHIIVFLQNEQYSKHVIDMKLEINRKKTLLSNFFLYILFVLYEFKQQLIHWNFFFYIKQDLVDIGVDIGVRSYQVNTNAFLCLLY